MTLLNRRAETENHVLMLALRAAAIEAAGGAADSPQVTESMARWVKAGEAQYSNAGIRAAVLVTADRFREQGTE